MNLRSVDLNLLVILDALLQEAHVSRAARRLHLSQPATSSALERCRALFKDPLLLRSKGGMHLTPKAERIKEEISDLLVGVKSVLEIDQHPLNEIQQTLRISMADSLTVRVASSLIQLLDEQAPGIRLVFTSWFGPGQALEQLAQGEVDLAVSQFPNAGVSYHTRIIGHEAYHVVMRRSHPAAQQFDLDAWLQWPHIVVSGRGENYSSVDQLLMGLGKSRYVAVVVPSFNSVPPLLLNSNLIATLPQCSLPTSNSNEFATFNPPINLKPYPLHIAWHRRQHQDFVTRYVAKYIEEQFATFQV